MGEDPIDTAWRELEGAWDDETGHKRFLALCAGLDRLGDAGRRYREVREGDPARAERAQQQIDRLLGMAMQNLAATRSEPPVRSGRTVMLLIALGVSGAIILTVLSLWLRLV